MMPSNSIAGGELLLPFYEVPPMAQQITLMDALESQRHEPRAVAPALPTFPAAPQASAGKVFGSVTRAAERIKMVQAMATVAAVDEVLLLDGLQKDVHKAAMRHQAILERDQGARGEEAELRRLLNYDKDVAKYPGAKKLAQKLHRELR